MPALQKNSAGSITVKRAAANRQYVRLQLATAAPSFSKQIVLLGKIANEWEIVKPLTIEFEYEDGCYIASDGVFVIYGTGDTRGEALRDYVIALIEYHDVLSSRTDEPTVNLFNHLQGYLRRINR